MSPRKTSDERLLATYVTVQQAADFLGVGKTAIMDRIRRKTLPAVVMSAGKGGKPRLYLVPRKALLRPRGRPGRPRTATGRRYVPLPETAASGSDTDFLEEALRELPGEAGGDGGNDARDTTTILDSRPGAASGPDDPEA